MVVETLSFQVPTYVYITLFILLVLEINRVICKLINFKKVNDVTEEVTKISDEANKALQEMRDRVERFCEIEESANEYALGLKKELKRLKDIER